MSRKHMFYVQHGRRVRLATTPTERCLARIAQFTEALATPLPGVLRATMIKRLRRVRQRQARFGGRVTH